ncbi:MAG: tetratricopeptide repeat protein [Vicinamibacterales bacterium]|nr:tetratricopeptide repeat protein [Vicinamibacterales bacterium]
MRADAIVFAVAGALFGVIVGWILGSQQAGGSPPSAVAAPVTATASTPAPAAGGGTPVVLDQNRVEALRAVAAEDPKNAQPRVDLGNMYFDAELYTDAIRWYEEAIAINPRDPNVSTDLGVAYYYTNQPARAVTQFEHSLEVDPAHTKTMLNMGIVKAFGQQDLAGAVAAWQQVVALAPDSPEGQAARKALDGMQQAHPTVPDGGGQ